MEAQEKLNQLKEKLRADQAKIFGLLFGDDANIIDQHILASLVMNMRAINKTIKFLEDEEEEQVVHSGEYIG